ncbi:MAG: LysM peptidoglycan-binding domain-containing protein [Candidatus Limnocylindrales bacterium]
MPVSVQALARDRGIGQGALLVLMAIAFAAIFIARLSTGGTSDSGGVLAGVGTPGPSASVTPTPSSSEPTVAASPVRTLVPTAVEPTAAPIATAAPAATPAPTATAAPTTYKVRRGDTLSGIAAEFGTTVKALSELNGIDDPSRLRVGQVLKLP